MACTIDQVTPVTSKKSTEPRHRVNSDEWRQIVDLRNEGESVSAIATTLGISRNTVRRALTFETPPRDHRPRSGSMADSLAPAIGRLLDVDPNMTVAQLHRELQWNGSRNTLARAVERVRAERAALTPQAAAGQSSNIPHFATSFVGRKDDLRSLRAMLGESRLVTIAGPGGIGKTRLAAEAASEYRRAFADGVRFIELASLRSKSLLPQAVLDGLGFGDTDLPEHSVLESLVGSVRDKKLLIVLDNCEHVISACVELISLILRSTVDVKILVTSREVLTVPDEHVYVLEPLSTENNSAAIELFENRASAAIAGFTLNDASRDAVRRVCIQLDGIPLAIELACARLTALSVDDLAARLDDRLALLTVGNRGGPDRHRSLNATVEWSYDLCNLREQALWSRLSIFAEGFDLTMAETVCANATVEAGQVLDVIAGLVSKSVLLRDGSSGTVRFRMLETLRHFGASKLTPDDAAQLRCAHLRWCSTLVESARSKWTGSEQERVSNRLRENRANLRLALQTALSSPTDESIELASDLIATWFLWSSAFSIREHRMWITQFLKLSTLSNARIGQLEATMGVLQTMQGDRAQAARTLESAVRRAELANDDATLAFARQTQGLNTYLGGDFEGGERHLDEALALYDRIPDGTALMWTAHIEMGMLCSSNGETRRAAKHFELVHEQASATGEKWMLSYSVYGLGLVALVKGEFEEAIRLATLSLGLKRAFDDTVGTTLVTDLLSWAEAAAGSNERAAVLLGAASSMWDSFGMQLYGSQHWVERREVYEARARKSLGNSTYTQSRQQGATMSRAQVIAFALKEERDQRADPRSTATSELSPRERDIASYVAQGLSNKEIANLMVLSVRTVEGHVAHVLRKLGITRRQQVVNALTDTAGRF